MFDVCWKNWTVICVRMREKEFRQNLRETGYVHMILDFIRVASFLVPSSSFLPASSTASSRSQWALPDLNHSTASSKISMDTPEPRAPDLSGHCQTSTASSGSQWALPDLNRKLQISVGTAGLQPRVLNGHCRTSIASAHCHTSRELQISVGTARPLRSGARGWGPAVPMSEERQNRCQIECQNRMSDRMPDRLRE